MALDPARYAELFRTESQDQLATINRALLALESERRSPQAVAEVFRAVHTLKGMAATMGYQAVAEFAHDLESRLDRLRGMGGHVTATMMDALFAAADALEAGVTAASETAPRTTEMSESIRRLSGAFSVEALATAAAASSDAPPAAAVEPATASAAPTWSAAADTPTADPGHDPFDGPGAIVRIRQSPSTVLPGVRAFMVVQRLRAIGEVVAISPPLDTLQAAATPLGFAVRLVTQATGAEIEAAVLSAGEIERVQVDIAGRARKRGTTPIVVPAMEASSAKTRQVRIDLARLDTMMNLVGELVIARGRLLDRAATSGDAGLDEAVQVTARLVGELQREITESRMVPVGQVFDRFPRMVRDAARSLGKDVRLEIEGRDIELDRALLDEVSEPLVHMLRNAVDHGLEGPAERAAAGKPPTGTLFLAASRDRSAVLITVADDGRGIDRARVLGRAHASGLVDPDLRELDDAGLLRCIAHPGFSTKETVTGLSGRGVGVDAVLSRVRQLGGSVELHTMVGSGSSFTLRLPPTVAIVRALVARAGPEVYVLPFTHVRETLTLNAGAVRREEGRDVLALREELLPVLDLREVVQLDAPRVAGAPREIVVIERGGQYSALIVDELVGEEDVVVKPFDAARGGMPVFTGATILGDGAPALIMDPASIL